MMNLKSVTDSELLESTKRLAFEERRIGIEVLHHLREIDDRKLFASLGYSSLYAYCTSELGYSEGGAYRRIAAMRLLREVPEYEEKLQTGIVTVATLSQVQSFLVQEKRKEGKTYTTDEKLELLAKIEGKSSQQTERALVAISPQLARVEKAIAINETETEIRFTASRELFEKMEKLQRLMGHNPKVRSYAGLIQELVDLGLRKFDRDLRSVPAKILEKAAEAGNRDSIPKTENTGLSKPNQYISSPPVEVKESRSISEKLKTAVWKRDGGRCTYVDTETGRRCESRHALEFEHIRPFSMGGENSLENLKLFCRVHNQYAAIQVFGLPKMQRYLKAK